MTGRDFVRWAVTAMACAAAALSAACTPGGGQSKRVPLLGYLSAAQPPAAGQTLPFIQGLRELGYVEGQSATVQSRFADGALDQLDHLAAELVALKPDVLVTPNNPPTQAAQRATGTIPIVFFNTVDPVGIGLVQSLTHPGQNLTGLQSENNQTLRKNLQLLQQLLPGLSQVGVVFSSQYSGMVVDSKSVEAAGTALGVRVQPIDIRGVEDFEAAFRRAADAHLQALFITGGPVTSPLSNPKAAEQLLGLAVKYRLPTASTSATSPGNAVIGYGYDAADQAKRAASYVDRILKGTRPAELPVESPTKFDLAINLKVAAAVGITVPPALLAQATEVIQQRPSPP